MEGHGMFIAGEWRDAVSGDTWPVLNPATEETVDEVPYGGSPDAVAALNAAAETQASWGRTSPFERSRLLQRAADLIDERAAGYARVTTEECGKPLAQSRAEWTSASELLRFAAAQAVQSAGRMLPARSSNRRIDVTWAPLGVVGLITAWNFPVYKVIRTVAKRLMQGASRTVTRLSLELGGNAPALILPDIEDLSAVAEGAVNAKYRNAGQVCIAPSDSLSTPRSPMPSSRPWSPPHANRFSATARPTAPPWAP